MTTSVAARGSVATMIASGFVAGALAVFTFHQMTILLLASASGGPANIYSTSPVAPFGVPQIVNQAFWGGLWGCVFALVVARFPRSWPLWLAGFVFGAVAPTLVGWFVVAPIKGGPIAQGFNPARMWRGPLINGMWGLGAALFYDLLARWTLRRTRWP
jgi:hypothetical protein